MKAVTYHKYGSPEVLELKEVEKPVPKDNEVLIKVYAASINSWDWDLLRGIPFLTRLGGMLKPKYKILGADVAGCIEAVGKNVTQFRPGDEVFGDISGCSWGGFAEYVCAHENALTLKSPRMTFDEAACMAQAAVLALQGLCMKEQIQKGQRVLINGAGGGVGTFAIQIAKSYGAEVTGVDSTGKLQMMRSIGADHVIDYTREDFTRNGKQYDYILDVMAHRSVSDYKRVLSDKGIYIVVGGSTSLILRILFFGFLEKKISILIHKPDKKDLNIIKELFEQGKLVPVIDSRYRLDQLPEALAYFGEGRAQGKVVITIQAP